MLTRYSTDFDVSICPTKWYQGIHIAVRDDSRELLLDKIEVLWVEHEELKLVDQGVTGKTGTGFIVLEWENYTIDAAFLAWLRSEEMIVDFSVYVRDEEN